MFINKRKLNKRKVSSILTLILSLSMIISSVFSVNVLVADDEAPVVETETVLVCGQEEHQHDATCFDDSGDLICVTDEHQHSDDCYVEYVPLEEIPENEKAFVETYDEEEVTFDQPLQYDEVDTSSLRLIVSVDKEALLDYGTIVSEEDSVYLIQFETEEDFTNAYNYYLENADFVDIDIPLLVMDETEEVETTETENVENEVVEEVVDSEVTTNEDNTTETVEEEVVENIETTETPEIEVEEVQTENKKVIALLDSGVNGKVLDAVSMVSEGLEDENGHGTRMYNIIKEKAPEADVISVKVLNKNGEGDLFDLYRGINYAVEYGAEYIVMPLTAYQPEGSKLIDKALNKANEKGVIVIAAAGNYNADASMFVPASNSNVIAVGAVHKDGVKVNVSNYGEKVEYYTVALTSSEASAKFVGYLFNSDLENIADNSSVFTKNEIRILEGEDYINYLENGLVVAQRESCSRLWNPLRQACPIEGSDLVDKEESARNYTYVEIQGKRYYDIPIVADLGTIPDKTPVRLNLVVKIPSDLAGDQRFEYKLPDNLAWEKSTGEIYQAGAEEPVGRYEVSGNNAYLVFTEEFLKFNSRVRARLIIDGYVDASLIKEEDDGKIDLGDIGEIEFDEITPVENSLQLSKSVAKNKTGGEITNWIVNNDNGTPDDKSDDTVTIYYMVTVKTTNGVVKNIHVSDFMDLEEGSLPLAPEYLIDGQVTSFLFGSDFGLNDYAEKLGNPTPVITTPYPGVDDEGNPIDHITGFDIDIPEWDSQEDGTLFITYGVTFTPSKGDPYTNPAENNFGTISNKMKGTGDNVPDVNTSDDFTYDSKPLDKTGAPITTQSFTARWTVTLNDYGDLTGFITNDTKLIIDILKDAEYDDSGTPKTATQVGYFDTSDQKIESLFEDGKPKNFSITAYKLNPETNKLRTISGSSAEVWEGMTAVADDSPITNAEEFVKHFIQNSDGSGGEGIMAPGNVKYIISFSSTIDPSEVDSMPSQKEKFVDYGIEKETPVYISSDDTQYAVIDGKYYKVENGRVTETEVTGVDPSVDRQEGTAKYTETNSYPVYMKQEDGTHYIEVEIDGVKKYYKVNGNTVTSTEVEGADPTNDRKVGNDFPVNMKNESDNGDDNNKDGSTNEEGVNVGPSQPTIDKAYGAVENASNLADWMIVLDITDEMVQVRYNKIFDYLHPGHKLFTDTPVEFYYYESRKAPSELSKLEDDKRTTTKHWQDLIGAGVAEVEHYETTTNNDGTTTPPKPTKENADSAYNFSVDIAEAVKKGYFGTVDILSGAGVPKTDPPSDGLKEGAYIIVFRTELDISETGPISGAGFTFTNRTYAIKDNTGDLIEDPSTTTRTIIDKTDLESNAALYKAATGKDLTDLPYQEIPWYVSALKIVEEMVISDSFSRSTSSGIGEMTLKEDSVIIYETDLDINDKKIRDEVVWGSADAPRITSGYTLKVLDDPKDGFEIHFENGAIKKSRIALFYVTEADVSQIDSNIKNLRYRNTATVKIKDGEGNPSKTDDVPKKYDLLDKDVVFDPEDTTKTAHYSIDVNKSKMDLNTTEGELGDILELTDTLDPYLAFVASSFKFYTIDATDSTGKVTQKTEVVDDDRYILDASDPHVLKIQIPDETPVRIEYDAVVTYNPEEGGEKTLTNVVNLNGFYAFSDSAEIQISVIEHKAEVEGYNFNIRLFKYDQDEPTKSLPDAEFDIYAYNVVEKDGVRELELLDSSLIKEGTNPIHIITDEFGEFVFHGKYDIVYKVVETKAPEGYIISDVAEYFVHPGNQEHDYFVDILDEYENKINPEIYHLYEDTDEIRYTMANRKAPYGLLLRKTGVDGKKILTGAVFNLYAKAEKDGEEDILVRENMRVNDEGELSFVNLEAGEYYLVEIEAPEGYRPYNYRLKITYDGDRTYGVDRTFFVNYIPSEKPEDPNVLIYKNGIIPIPKTGVE